MDSGLGVQWPLSPFATAIATGALFAFGVALWNKRPNGAPPQKFDPIEQYSIDQNDACRNELPECSGAIKRHVLKLEIPTDINTSVFSFPSIYHKSNVNEESSDALVFALPATSDSNSVTIKLLDFDGRYSKLNIGPCLKEKVSFGLSSTAFGNPFIYFPKPDPREELRFRINVNPEKFNQFMKYRYPYKYRLSSQKSFNVFKKYSYINERFLDINCGGEAQSSSVDRNAVVCVVTKKSRCMADAEAQTYESTFKIEKNEDHSLKLEVIAPTMEPDETDSENWSINTVKTEILEKRDIFDEELNKKINYRTSKFEGDNLNKNAVFKEDNFDAKTNGKNMDSHIDFETIPPDCNLNKNEEKSTHEKSQDSFDSEKNENAISSDDYIKMNLNIDNLFNGNGSTKNQNVYDDEKYGSVLSNDKYTFIDDMSKKSINFNHNGNNNLETIIDRNAVVFRNSESADKNIANKSSNSKKTENDSNSITEFEKVRKEILNKTFSKNINVSEKIKSENTLKMENSQKLKSENTLKMENSQKCKSENTLKRENFQKFKSENTLKRENSPVLLSVEINGTTYGGNKCHDVNYDEPALTRASSSFGGIADVKMSINYPKVSIQKPRSMKENLEAFQKSKDKEGTAMTPRKKEELSLALETKQTYTIGRRSNSSINCKEGVAGSGGTTTNDRDVRGEGEGECSTSRTRTADEREARLECRQMDRRTGERSDGGVDSCIFETSITSETLIQGNGGTRVSSSVTVDTSNVWVSDTAYSNGKLKTVVTMDSKYNDNKDDGVFRPTYEEYMADERKSLDATIKELNEIAERPLVSPEPSSPRVSRLKALLSRDEERRARMKFFQEKSSSVNGSGGAGASIDGEWDRILRDVLASVSELEHWEKDEEQRRRCDVTVSEREDAEKRSQHLHSDSSPNMEGEAAVLSPSKGETPTKVKNLRFKLDPDVFDVPSDDSFYDDDDDDFRRWKKQPKYRTFSSLELSDEPVKLVSVHASVVPAGQKMVARPVGIDLRVRLTEERQSKRAHVGTSPSQVKRRSPVSDARVGWCQELSPVTENVDWRETFTPVPKDTPETVKPVPNGILKSPSPKIEVTVQDSANPFKTEQKLTNGTPVAISKKAEKPLTNGVAWKPKPPEKKFSLPRKKFTPDPEAVDRITGYKLALSKPPLPPPVYHRVTSPSVKASRAEIARKQYLDNKASLSTSKVDGDQKFQQFVSQAQNDRARIVTSVPDLVAIEKAVSEQWARERTPSSQRESPAREDASKYGDSTSSRGSTPDDAWASYVQSCRKHLGRRSQSMTYLETDVDIVDIPLFENDDKWRSTSALGEPDNSESSLPIEDSDLDQSQDDLDDSGRAKSEHELRIQKSLQSLPLPSWYKQSEKPKSGFLLGSGKKEKRGWAAAKSLASSTSSLASCGLKRPVHSLRSSRENIPWSRSSPSPDGPALSLALARAFREPYLGWRARTSTTSSGVSSSPRTSPPSWSAATTDEEANGISFDGEDAFGRTSSQDDRREDPPSLDDTGADAVTVSMDTGDLGKLPGGEDTCDDINNMSMDTCELFDISIVPDVEEPDVSPQADTGDDIDNLSTDTIEEKRKDPKFKRFSYSQSIYNSEWDDEEESRGDLKSSHKNREMSLSSDNKVIWIESSFVGSRTTTSIMVLPEDKKKREGSLERPASR